MMDSTNHNGTPPSLCEPSPPQPVTQEQAPSAALKDTCLPSPLAPCPQTSSTPSLTHVDGQGEITNPSGPVRPSTVPPRPTWDAAALLNPKGFRTEAGAQRPLPPPGSNSNGVKPNSNNPVQVEFQFSNSLNSSNYPPSTSSSLAALDPMNSNPNGMSSMIERMNKVQDRSTIPMAKRRKIEDPFEDDKPKNGFHGGGSGMLSDYVKQKQQEGQSRYPPMQAQSTLDLTGGILLSSHLMNVDTELLTLTRRR